MSDRTQAQPTTLADDEIHRITRFDFEPGAETGWHVHGFDYVIVALSACEMRLEMPDGSVNEVSLPPGRTYHRPVGVEHNVINGGTAPMAFVELEFKQGLDLATLDKG